MGVRQAAQDDASKLSLTTTRHRNCDRRCDRQSSVRTRRARPGPHRRRQTLMICARVSTTIRFRCCSWHAARRPLPAFRVSL